MKDGNKHRNSRISGRTVVLVLLLIVTILSVSGCNNPEGKNAPVQPEKQGMQSTDQQQTTSVKVQTRTVTGKETAISIDLKIPQISGMKDDKVQQSINEAMSQPSLQMRDQNIKDAREYYQETQSTGDHFWQYEVASDYTVHYNQNGILSITTDNYQFTGGAHGGTERLPFNYDLNTGELMSLKDIFSPGFDYQSIIDAEVKSQIAKQPEIYFEDSEGFKGIGSDRPYYLMPGYVVVYFAQYEIAPYSTGMPEFKIPVEKFGNSIDKRLK